jgi:hypothetical protein
MGKWKESICGRMQAICNCFSAASRQAREAEIDIPSKRRFSLMYTSGGESVVRPKEKGLSIPEVVIRTGIGIQIFLDCLNNVKDWSENSPTDPAERMSYRKVPE